MSRRRKNKDLARDIMPDPNYNDVVVARFINKLMWDGKKEKARTILYKAFDKIKTIETSEEPLAVFKKALANCKPEVEVRSRRVGGATYQVPVSVRPARKTALAMRWLVEFARGRKGKPIVECLAAEIMDAYSNKGNSVKKKDDVHRMAEANRAFSHYNW